jgi:hypothetical protein
MKNWKEMLKKIELHASLVLDVFYSYCILYNLTIKCGTVDVDKLMQQMALEAEEEICQRHSREWRLTKVDELEYKNWLEESENLGHILGMMWCTILK